MRVKIKNLNNLKKTLESLSQEVAGGAYQATVEVTESIEAKAKSRLQSEVKYPSGGLVSSVEANTERGKDEINGVVAVKSPIGAYREFGTGPVGQASQKDLPDGVTPVYTQEPWLFPVDSVGADLTDRYGIPKVTIKEKQFYLTHGQPARPFFYPSINESKEGMEEIYQEHISKNIRKLAK